MAPHNPRDERPSALVPALVGLATTAVVGLLMMRSDGPWTLALDAGMSFLGQTVPAFRAWAAGSVPEWSDLLWGGFPLIAEPTTAALYPPHAIAYLLTWHAPLRFFDVVLALHLGILAAGSAAFVRRLGAGTAAVVLAGVLAALCPFGHGIAIDCTAELVAMAWWPWTLLAADQLAAPGTPLVGGAMVAGWLVLAAQGLSGVPEYALYSGTAAAVWILCRSTTLGLRRRVVRIAMLGAGGAALAAPQIMATLAYLPVTTRAGEPIATELGSLWIASPARMLLVGLGAMNGVTCFLGIGLLALVAAGLVLRRDGLAILVAIAVASFLLALGPQAGLYRVLHRIPPFDRFRVPVKLYGLTEYGLAWSAALGADALWRRAKAGMRWTAVLLAILAVVEHGIFVTTSEQEALAHVYRDAPRPELLSALAEMIPRYPGHIHDPPPVMLDLGPPFGGRLVGSLGALLTIASLHAGDVALLPHTHATLLYANIGDLKQTPALLGVRYALVPLERCERMQRYSRWVLGKTRERFCVLANPAPAPPFESIVSATAVSSVDAMLAAMTQRRKRDPVPVVAAPEELTALDTAVVGTSEYAPGRIRLTVVAPEHALVLVRQSLVPGWEARVDGVPATIVPAAGLYFALPLRAGKHAVELDYRAPGLRVGALVTLAWALGTAAWLVWRRRRRIQGKRTIVPTC